MKRSDLHDKPGTIFRYEQTFGARGYGHLFVVEKLHDATPEEWRKLGPMTSRRGGCNPDKTVKVEWSPPAVNKPKRTELKPGTVFRYLTGPSANWEMYVPWADRHWPEYTRQHPETPAALKNSRASCPGPSDMDKEVEVLWVPPVKTPPVVNKGQLANKIANRPKLDSLANGLKKLDTTAELLKKWPVVNPYPGFNTVFPLSDAKPVNKKPPPLPTDDKARKALPVFTGPLMYFPHALLQIGAVCKAGNDQHNPGEPMHWAREKSTDQLNTALRHMMDHGLGNTRDTDGQYHLAKAAWRILAELQLTIERDLDAEKK